MKWREMNVAMQRSARSEPRKRRKHVCPQTRKQNRCMCPTLEAKERWWIYKVDHDAFVRATSVLGDAVVSLGNEGDPK